MILGLACLLAGCMPLPSIDDEYSGGQNSGNTTTVASPIAYYTFEGNANDVSANRFNGVLAGAPEFIPDTPDGSSSCLKINGFKKQYVNIPYPILSKQTTLSVSFWIKDFSQGAIFTSNGSSYGLCSPRLVVTDSQKFEFYTHNYYANNGTDHRFVYDCTSIMSNEWHHIVVTADNGVNSLYLDGQKMDSMKAISGANTSTKVYIGGNVEGFLGTYVSMKIDNLAFYDECLSDREVKYIYQNLK